MPKVPSDNPAGRLYRILKPALSRTDAVPFGIAIKEACTFLGPDKPIHYYIYQLLLLVEEIETKINSIEDINHVLFLENIHKIKTLLLQPSLHAKWQNLKDTIDQMTMKDLAFCSDILSKNFPEGAMDENELKDIFDSINLLFEKIHSSPIDIELKTLMLDMLEATRRAISEFRIRGAASIRKVVKDSIGEWYASSETFKENIETDDVSLFWRLIARLDNLSSIAMNVPQIVTKVTGLTNALPVA